MSGPAPTLPGATRRERKTNWERINRSPCPSCGTPMSRGYERCVNCRRRADRIARDMRRAKIAAAWAQGATAADIADDLGTTVGTVFSDLHRMRAEGGWEVPLRRRGARRTAGSEGGTA